MTLNTKRSSRMNSPQLYYYDLGEGVTAFSTTRHGGVSQGNYGSFNINPYCGDDTEHVACNCKLLADSLNIPTSHIILPHQVHGIEHRTIAPELFSMSGDVRNRILDGVDIVTTAMTGVCIGVSTADCIPILLYDPTTRTTAAIHAGWRGTVAGISAKTIDIMKQKYGVNPANLRAVIGPGISLRNFEVGDEVYDKFAEAGFDMPSVSRRYAKWHIDLWECNRQTLLHCGLKDKNIHIERICTYDNTDKLFSARVEQTGIEKCGRNFNAIMTK